MSLQTHTLAQDFKTYWKHAIVCKQCNKHFGSDYPQTSKICPICEAKMRKENAQ